MTEMICPDCGRFHGVLKGEAQIKCPRCKKLTIYRSESISRPDLQADTGREPRPKIGIGIDEEWSTIN